jgi:hypothetical protein
LENLKGRDHLGDTDIDRMMIIKLILKKYGVRVWTGFMWLRLGFGSRLL